MTSIGGFFSHLPRGTVLRLLAGLLAVWLGHLFAQSINAMKWI